MKTERSATPGPAARRSSHRIALVALALATIGLGGCQSLQSINPFRNCNGCGPLSRLGSGTGNGLGGLFNHKRNRVIYDAEPPIVIDSAPGVEVITPGAPIITSPGPPVGAPLVEPDPALTPLPDISPPADRELNLGPMPEATGRTDQGTINSRATSGRGLGSRPDARAPQYAFGGGVPSGDPYSDAMTRRSSDVALAARPVTDPTSGPVRAEPRPVGTGSLQLFDRLPDPQSIAPAEPDEPGPTPPPTESPPEAPPEAADPDPPAAVEPAPPPPEAPQGPGVEVSRTEPTIPEPQQDTAAASGIAAFSSVEPHLAGGAVPSEGGWTALADRGYRTVLDLRPVDQIRPADFAASSRLGLRHVLLPMTPGTIDGALVARFEDEIAQEAARPILFCDADGSAAAALWYVHRIAVDRYEHDRALRDAERIAPIPPALMAAARGYLDGQRTTSSPDDPTPAPPVAAAPIEPAPTPAPAPTPEPDPSPTVAADPLPPVESASAPEPTPTVAEQPMPPEPAPAPASEAARPAETTVAEVFEDPFAKPAPADLKAWGPYAALFLSVLVVPLAYWGSAVGIPVGLRTRVRASLSAPSRRPQSLPASSDAGT